VHSGRDLEQAPTFVDKNYLFGRAALLLYQGYVISSETRFDGRSPFRSPPAVLESDTFGLLPAKAAVSGFEWNKDPGPLP
jgi:hypothetical protein